jgi:hypothetical protein
MPDWESREQAAEYVDEALEFQKRLVTADQRDLIIDYAWENKAACFHAIALVLRTCCHCVKCIAAGGIRKRLE